MNGFAAHGLDEDAFGQKPGFGSKLRTFDAFPKTKPTYTTASRRGGQWTLFTLIFCAILAFSELYEWYKGKEYHHFSVEKGVSREMQFNVDMVVKMQCKDLNVVIRDAAGDNILAGTLLKKEPTSWDAWIREGLQEYQTLHDEDAARLAAQEEDQHVTHVLGEVKRSLKKKFPKGPKMKRTDQRDSCRIYGSLEGNKVQADFHITARGFGYPDYSGKPLSPQSLNFSHLVNELSFGPHYSTLLNPLDKTITTTGENFEKFQYFLSVVPTVYTKAGIVDPDTKTLPDPSTITPAQMKHTIFTNQYAVTSHTRTLPASWYSVPGIFFKYNIEPILLVVSEERGSLLALLVRLVNVASGVMVAGGWLFRLSDWAMEVFRKRRRISEGLLTGRDTDE
ncbi:hypothetical protein VTO42DRAFT_7176 [Malbranchea cinnamomea]